MSHSLLTQKWPILADELTRALLSEGDTEYLADQVPSLEVVAPCGCDDDFCQSFFTAEQPTESWGPSLKNICLAPSWPGYLILDVVDGRIVYVEVLFRPPLD